MLFPSFITPSFPPLKLRLLHPHSLHHCSSVSAFTFCHPRFISRPDVLTSSLRLPALKQKTKHQNAPIQQILHQLPIMQLTHVLVLACSTLALAKPYHPRSGGEWHHPYKHKPGCSSASTGAGAVSAASASASGYYTNSSSAALPYSVGPTVVTGAPTAGPTAGGGPLSPLSSPSEGGVTASSSTALAPVQSSSTTVKAPTSTVAAAPVQSSTAAAAPVSGGTTYTATFTE